MTTSLRALGCATFALSAFATPAMAQSDTSFTIGEIVVTARKMTASIENVVTSVDIMSGSVAQHANVDYAWELIGQMPGIQITEFNQGAVSGKFSFRGFNGEGNINAAKLLIDGVPSNSNSGNMPHLDMVFPLEIERIEVVRGTSDPRYGLHAIAGSANIITRSGGTYVDAKLTGGSNATYEAQAAAGLESGRFSQNYLVAYRDSGGYREHSDLSRLSLSGKWFFDATENVRFGAIARYYRSNAQEAGYLTRADAHSTPRMTNAYNATDGDRRRIGQYSVHLDASLNDAVGFTARGYYNRMRDDRHVKFSTGASQQRRVANEDNWGGSAVVHIHATPGGLHSLMVEIGGDFEKQDNESLRYLTVARVPTSQTRDQQFDLSMHGIYAQAIIEPTDWLKITPAYRIDWVGGDFANRLNNTTAPINDYGAIKQPKLSVAVLPAKGVTLYGNWGKTFQIGAESGAYLIPPRRVDLDPSINEGWEAGVKVQASHGIEGRVALWKQTATGEIRRKLNDPLGDFENVGATRRKGIDVQLSARPTETLSLWVAVAWQKAIITRPDPATPSQLGNDIDHTPRWLTSAGIDWRPIEPLRLSLSSSTQSSYELTNDGGRGRFGKKFSVNADASWQIDERFELGVQVKNLTNDYYEYVWWDGAQTLHSPADNRTVYATLRARF